MFNYNYNEKNLLLNSNQFLRIETFCTKYFAPR